jgi:protein phosphatase
VPHDVIENTLRADDDPANAVDVLMKAALDHGGRDNVTVLVIEVVG